MKLNKVIIKLTLLSLALCAIITAVYVFLPILQDKNSEETNNGEIDSQDGENNSPDEQDFSKDVSEISQGGWIPYWDFDRGYDSLTKNKDKFESISPVWYSLNSDGTLLTHKRASHEKLETFVKENNILLIPTVGMFDFEIIKKVLNSSENYERHIDSILKVVDENDYDGIDIDYESIELVDKELFLNFLEELSTELHERNKVLTIDVLSKWGDGIVYPSLVETREVQDWSELAKYVDEIRIMAYDYTSTHSKYPGPIGPIPWIYEVLQYAVEVAPREKIVLGVHLYGYEWVNEEYNSELDFFDNPMAEKIQVNAFEYSDIVEIKKKYQFDERRDDSLGEVIFSYDKNGSSRTAFYIDGAGVAARKELAAQFGIKGVAYWRLGGEDDSGF